MKTKTLLWSTLGSLALMTSAGSALAHGIPAGAIQGTWVVHITPYACDTGESFPQFTAVSYLTFHADKTMLETTSNPNFQPGQRSAGLGYWERTSPGNYHAVFQAFIQFTSDGPSPRVRGSQRIEQGIEFQDRDHWTSDAAVTFYDVAGVLVLSGCASAVGERMQ